MKKYMSAKIFRNMFVFGIAAGVLFVASTGFAQQDLGASVNKVHTGLLNIPNIIVGAFYCGGAAILGAGFLKLKAHSESPGQHPLGHAMGRIVVGGVLMAIPAIATWVQNSIGAAGITAASSQTLGTIK